MHKVTSPTAVTTLMECLSSNPTLGRNKLFYNKIYHQEQQSLPTIEMVTKWSGLLSCSIAVLQLHCTTHAFIIPNVNSQA